MAAEASTNVFETILYRARNVPQLELDEFYDKFLKNSTNIDHLRQLFLVIHCTRQNHCLPDEVANALLATLCSSSSSTKVGNLSTLTLVEASPLPVLQLEETFLSLIGNQAFDLLPLIIAQEPSCYLNEKIISKCIRLFANENNKTNKNLMKLLGVLFQLMVQPRLPFSLGQVIEINKFLGNILHKASIYQAPNPTIFRRSDNVSLITEIDGVSSREFFTVLSLAQYNTEDQFLNIAAFSFLQTWIYWCFQHQDKSNLEFDEFYSKVAEYCIRILDQCNRKPVRIDDEILEIACLVEAIAILNLLCQKKSLLVPMVFPAVKRVYQKLGDDPLRKTNMAAVLLSVLEFMVHHCEIVGYDIQAILDNVFISVLSSHFYKNYLAIEIILFIKNNLAIFQIHSNILPKYFPNILKILAWQPITYFEDFLDILPALISHNTSIEIFHSLLDLPCLTAAIIVQLTIQGQSNEKSSVFLPHTQTTLALIQAFTDPQYKPLFGFILRNTSGVGDTFSRLNSFHELIRSLSNHPMVRCCGEIVPALLRIYFQVILKQDNPDLIPQLISAFLDRISLIYGNETALNSIQKTLADEWLDLFQLHPEVIVKQYSEIIDYICNLQNFTAAPEFFINTIWIIGEYTSHNALWKPELITCYYETTECLLYEFLGNLKKTETDMKLVIVICMTLAKLATRCQDLVPRVLLCLTKVEQQIGSFTMEEQQKRIVTTRVTQLLSLLRMPNVASIILSPSSQIHNGRWHRDNSSVQSVVAAINKALEDK